MPTFIIRVSFALVFTSLLISPPALQCPQLGESILSTDRKLSAGEPAQFLLPRDLKDTPAADLSFVVAIDQPHPKPPSLEIRPIKLAKNQRTIIELHLGEYLDNQEVIVNLPDRSAEYRLFQRYRTSVSIANEGPHLDLVNWRHFDSPWFQLPSSGERRFRTLKSDQMDSVKFPPTTQSDILKEVRREVGSDSPFIEVAKSCNGPNDGACWVGISSIYLRLQKQVRSRWIDIALVEFRLPMGC